MPSQDAIDRDRQLALYSLGLQKRWPHLAPDDIKMSLYYLKHEEKLSTKATTESTERTKTHILETVAEIKERMTSGREFEPMPGPLCNWCAFKPICPAWKHLYSKNDQAPMTNAKIGGIIKEYFALKEAGKHNEERLTELQQQIKDYMEQEGLTRVFGDKGVISKKTIQRYAYDWGKIKDILSPLGKWEEVLKGDETKLRKIFKEIPKDTRHAIEETQSIAKEYQVITASLKKVGDEVNHDTSHPKERG